VVRVLRKYTVLPHPFSPTKTKRPQFYTEVF
jgi:hypothetical protein